MTSGNMKVGELASRTGVTVRALHHYHEIGLLSPSARSPSGHRLYTERDVVRLLRIRSLQQIGFSLEQIRECLDNRGWSPLRVLETHLERLRRAIDDQQKLCRRLESLARRLRADEEIAVGEFLEAIEEMTMFEKYYTPEQLKKLEERGRLVGEERIREVEAEWPKLIAAVRSEMEKGTDPGDPSVQRLARRWQDLIDEFTGGDEGIRRSLQSLYAGEPSVRERHGLDPEIMDYVGRALG